MSTGVRVWLVLAVVAGLLVGLTAGLLLRPWSAPWLEAVGTWFSAALSAGILAVLAYRSEKFTRALEDTRKAQAADKAQTELQNEADLIECGAALAKGEKVEPGVVLVQEIGFFLRNNSSYASHEGELSRATAREWVDRHAGCPTWKACP